MDFQTYGIFIALIGVVASVVVPVSIHFKEKKKKILTFEVVQNLSVINVNDKLKDKIEIKYANKLVTNLFFLTARIRNNGNVSIKKSDIISPINISFKEKFIECIVIEKNPEGIKENLIINNNQSVDCSFNLLNPRESFTLQFVSLEELSSDPKIVSRIDGLSNVNVTSILDKNSKQSLYHIIYQIIVGVTAALVASIIMTKYFY